MLANSKIQVVSVIPGTSRKRACQASYWSRASRRSSVQRGFFGAVGPWWWRCTSGFPGGQNSPIRRRQTSRWPPLEPWSWGCQLRTKGFTDYSIILFNFPHTIWTGPPYKDPIITHLISTICGLAFSLETSFTNAIIEHSTSPSFDQVRWSLTK